MTGQRQRVKRDPRDVGIYHRDGKVRVRLRHPNDWQRTVNVGTFSSVEEARRARDEAMERLRAETPIYVPEYVHVRRQGSKWKACPLIEGGERVELGVFPTRELALAIARAYLDGREYGQRQRSPDSAPESS